MIKVAIQLESYVMRSIRLFAPAKINLFLRVLGKRPDGYHNIETLFQEIDLRDELILKEGTHETSLEVPGHPELETDDNLVMKALRWLEKETGRRLHVDITLIKRIPSAVGLGGGSSDAAAALVGLTTLFRLDLREDGLIRAARSLGADVPFFLKGGTAVGEGIGERLTPVSFPLHYEVLLIHPGFQVSTATVFREFSRILTDGTREARLWRILAENRDVRDLLHNDLQPVAERLYPEISEMSEAMVAAGWQAGLMTGSGPTVFGLAQPDEMWRLRTDLGSRWTKIVARPSNRGIVMN